MYRNSYVEIAEDSADAARAREREAFGLMIGRLEEAAATGHDSKVRRDALGLCTEFWRFLIADLADERNALPEQTRADLVSIGLWAMREADRLLAQPGASFDGLIEVHRTILAGLE